jgi:hypothetical protein
MRPVMECFERWGVRHAGLYTFATSLQHVGLYRKFGFLPRLLTMMMEKEMSLAGERSATGDADAADGSAADGRRGTAGVGDRTGVELLEASGGTAGVAADAAGRSRGAVAASWMRFSAVPAEEREAMLERCAGVTGKVLEGLDVSVDIRSVADQQLGETVLLYTWDELTGLAVCHCGAGTEAGSGVCYIKFACVWPALGGDVEFRRLLAACEQLAKQRGLKKVAGGMNMARQQASVAMQSSGYRGTGLGVAMQRPNEPGYNRPEVFVIDDWR